MSEKKDLLSNPYLPKSVVVIPASDFRPYVINYAIQQGCSQNILIYPWGGIGDQVCAEPTIRYMLNTFKNCKFTLWSETPELFAHLKFDHIYTFSEVSLDPSKYILFQTITFEESLFRELVSHVLTHPVDFCSLLMLRSQLPQAAKNIELKGDIGSLQEYFESTKDLKKIVIHAGKHWDSKTFPKEWWDSILLHLQKEGYTPVLIGKNYTNEKFTVDVNPEGCIDLRNKTNLSELIYLLQNERILLSNDSSPIHIAASGEAHIGFIASCKHPEFLKHQRKGGWGWRTYNLEKDGLWNYTHFNPLSKDEINVGTLPEGLMEKLLPTPQEIVQWVNSLKD